MNEVFDNFTGTGMKLVLKMAGFHNVSVEGQETFCVCRRLKFFGKEPSRGIKQQVFTPVCDACRYFVRFFRTLNGFGGKYILDPAINAFAAKPEEETGARTES